MFIFYLQIFDGFFFPFAFVQHCHVTLKMDCVDGIRTTVTTLTGRCTAGWTTPSGSVRNIQNELNRLMKSCERKFKMSFPDSLNLPPCPSNGVQVKASSWTCGILLFAVCSDAWSHLRRRPVKQDTACPSSTNCTDPTQVRMWLLLIVKPPYLWTCL